MLDHEGKQFARVTDVIAGFQEFSNIPPAVLENKARIGQSVHKNILEDICGELVLPSSECLGYFKSYCLWKEALNPKIEQAEKRYFCEKKMLTGQIDCLVSFPNDPFPILVDFKTSANEGKQSWPLQGHLYHYLLKENGLQPNTSMLFVKLDKSGKLPKVYSYSWNDFQHQKSQKAVDDFWQKIKTSSNITTDEISRF